MTVLSGLPFWLDELPSGWGLVEGRYIARIRKEVPGPGRSDSYDRLSLTMRGVLPRSRDAADGLQPETFDSYQLLRPGQLVFKLIDLANFATSRVGLSADTGLVSPAYIVMSPGPQLNSRFAFYYFYDLYVRRIFNAIAGDGVRSALGPADLRELVVPLPPFEEQRAIADYLDRETEQIDAFIAKNQELITLLTERRAASIDDAFERLDAKRTRLKYCAAIQTGVTLGGDGDPADPEWPYLRVANVQVGRVDLDEIKTIRVPEARARQSMLSDGDVLMTEGGDRDKLGRGALWSGEVEPMLHQNHVFAVKVGPNLNARFLMRWLDASPSREYFETTAVQTTNLASTNKTLVGNLPLPSCSVGAQSALVEVLDSRLEKNDEAIAIAERSVKLAGERRAALISAAVTGKIDVGVTA